MHSHSQQTCSHSLPYAGNYAKRNYFKKKTLKAQRLQWQREDIPRSLFKLSTEFCGTVPCQRVPDKQ